MSSFKQKYNSDPVFRSRVIQKALTKVECGDCGRKVQRSNFSRHINSTIHKKKMRENNHKRVLEQIRLLSV
jgi:hypothetical protein